MTISDKATAWLHLRQKIDRQKNPEKGAIPVDLRDPAAAPAETDQEAGGQTSHPDKIR